MKLVGVMRPFWLRWRWLRAACASNCSMAAFTNYEGLSRSKIEPCKGLAAGFGPPTPKALRAHTGRNCFCYSLRFKSGRQDSNLRPSAPKAICWLSVYGLSSSHSLVIGMVLCHQMSSVDRLRLTLSTHSAHNLDSNMSRFIGAHLKHRSLGEAL